MTAAAAKVNKGSKHSEATLAKFKSRSFTDEQRAKISAAAKIREAKIREAKAREARERKLTLASTTVGNRVPILVTNVITSESTPYSSLSAAGKVIGVSKDTIKKYLESGDLLRETYVFAKQ